MNIKKSITRRDVLDKGLKGGVATTAFMLGGGTPFMSSRQAFAQAADISAQQLRTVGLSVTVQERILEDFKAQSGVGEVNGKADIFPNTQTELLSGSNAYDCWEIIGERLPAMTVTNTIDSIATSDLANWANIRSTFVDADPNIEPRAQISGQIWADDAKTQLWMVPTVYNFDSIGARGRQR